MVNGPESGSGETPPTMFLEAQDTNLPESTREALGYDNQGVSMGNRSVSRYEPVFNHIDEVGSNWGLVMDTAEEGECGLGKTPVSFRGDMPERLQSNKVREDSSPIPSISRSMG